MRSYINRIIILLRDKSDIINLIRFSLIVYLYRVLVICFSCVLGFDHIYVFTAIS